MCGSFDFVRLVIGVNLGAVLDDIRQNGFRVELSFRA